MRKTNSGPLLSLRAISGTHVVLLAWDVRPEFDTRSLLGFAIERTEYSAFLLPVEKYYLRGIKRFLDKDRGLPPGTPVPTSEHPIQSFQWGDYTVRPGRHYAYRLVPCTGAPKLLALDDARAITVEIDTEPEHEEGQRHSIYFNRGLAGSQAYAREFGEHPVPDVAHPESRQMTWLSRGLYEALRAFIARASGATFGLRAALYEFHYEPVGRAFRDALDSGADVKILYDQPSYGTQNEKMIRQVGLSAVCAPRAAGAAQKHNKFIVLLEGGKPVAVWTGSTNLSAGGLFGHSNVGHVVHDADVAREYLDAWDALCNPLDPPPASKPFRDQRTDPARKPLALRNNADGPTPASTPTPTAALRPGSITTLFSPREPATLQWYADLLASAKQIACITIAFTLSKEFEPFLEEDNDVLRFVLSDKQLKQGELITRDRDVLYAAGAKFEEGTPGAFVTEELTGLNNNYYIHDKFMLVDPLGEDGTVVTGSANFSGGSQTSNDENMLVIRADPRVCDIYFGEFMRLFDHLYARYLAKVIREREKKGRKKSDDPNRGYLAPDARWVADHLGDGRKSRRRQYFHGTWR